MTGVRIVPCPTCKSSEIRRSHRKNNFERLLSVAFVPCRCQACDGRFFRPRWMVPAVIPVVNPVVKEEKANASHG